MAHETWDDIRNAPCFVINMDRCKDRLEKSVARIREAGFERAERFRAVDAVHDPLGDAWQIHGNPMFDPSDTEFVTYPGKQGCMLSHLHLWKKIIDEGIPMAVVFEDDVCFHSKWGALAPRYYASTPKDFDILYLGSQIDFWMDGHIVQTPVFCTHAYVITGQGARILYNLLLQDPKGVRTIDCMLIDHMKERVFRGTESRFQWYVWNGLKFPEEGALSDPHWAKRNTGLVFQDVSLGTFVRPWHDIGSPATQDT